jgi:hypothetical protein
VATLQDCDPPETVDATLIVAVSLNSTILEKGGLKMPALTATWAPIDNPYITDIEFQYGPSDLSSGIISKLANKGSQSWSSTDSVIANETYAVQYRAIGLTPETFGPWVGPANIVAGAEWVANTVKDQGALATKSTVDTPDVDSQAINAGVASFTSAAITLTGVDPLAVQSVVLNTDGEELIIDIGFHLYAKAGASFTRTIRLVRDTIPADGSPNIIGFLAFSDVTTAPQVSGSDFFAGWERPPIIPDQPVAGSHNYRLEVFFSTNSMTDQVAKSRGIVIRRFKDDR